MARKEYRGRTATVYLPAEEILTAWQNEAKQGGATISDYIFEMVEKARRPADDQARPELVRENSDIKTLNRKLEQEVNLLKANLEIMQAEVYKQRFAGFEQVDAPGMHSYDKALVDMLKRGKILDSQEILGSLGINPRDSQAVKLVSNQLEELKRFGLVSESIQGWRWL
ncbi:MAG TPA: hypothetical protein PLI05_08895 [Methanotrichaceae archaeon]|nr:hypothetical protein [Methanotrichaceae archaeon]HQF17169.1 hypothetical protein [Methanotrichaceae archaeon]HQI91569.1 hypothetical protein [Methanotrichaceae archaeon]